MLCCCLYDYIHFYHFLTHGLYLALAISAIDGAATANSQFCAWTSAMFHLDHHNYPLVI